jgi:uncharacterized membrane protein YeiB
MMTTDSDYMLEPSRLMQPLVYAFGVPALALFYVVGLLLLYQKSPFKSKLSFFALYDRMALTN